MRRDSLRSLLWWLVFDQGEVPTMREAATGGEEQCPRDSGPHYWWWGYLFGLDVPGARTWAKKCIKCGEVRTDEGRNADPVAGLAGDRAGAM